MQCVTRSAAMLHARLQARQYITDDNQPIATGVFSQRLSAHMLRSCTHSARALCNYQRPTRTRIPLYMSTVLRA
jgi:hypothetical protein